MTETVQLAVLGAVVAIFTGLPTWVGQMRAARKSAETAKKVDAVIVGNEKIHELANSNLSKATSALEVATATNTELRASIAAMTETKRQDDAAKATASLVAKIPDQPKAE